MIDDAILDALNNRQWRLNNLYSVHDRVTGQVIHYNRNHAQRWYARERHDWNLLTKARRAGFSTEIGVRNLDRAIFNDHQSCGIIDITRPDAEKKLSALKSTYERIGLFMPGLEDSEARELNEWLLATFPLTPASKRAESYLEFENGSMIEASTTFRGGTLQALHISEFGPICDERPKDAEKIKTGAFPAVATGCDIDIESTYKGPPSGLFYEMIEEAQSRIGCDLHGREFKFLFFGFHMDPNSVLRAGSVTFTPECLRAFDEWKRSGIHLTEEQKAFWAAEWRKLKLDTFREWPCVPPDMFKSPIEGAIYGEEIAKLKSQGRYGDFWPESRFPCFAAWDLGWSDSCSIWLIQATKLDFRVLDYYEASHEPVAHFKRKLDEWESEYDIQIERNLLPHDGAHHSRAGKTFVDEARAAGVRNIRVVPVTRDVWAGIKEGREVLDNSVVHTRCKKGLDLLASYRTEKDKPDKPLHDHTSHCADSWRTFAEARLHGLVSPHNDPARRGRIEVIRA